jgi:hypothetical protein
VGDGRLKSSSEASHQEGFINWFRLKFPDVLIFHIPNGEQRALSVGVRLKKQGVVAGIPDLFIPSLKIFIELKRKDGGAVSKEQEKIIAYLQRVGYTVWVCHGAEEASIKILDFLQSKSIT